MQLHNLILDFGNTLCKLFVFQNNDIISSLTFDRKEQDCVLKSIFNNLVIQNTILSSVIDIPTSTKNILKSNSYLLQLTSSTPIPIENKYTTPGTLGNDRLASVVGVNSLYPNKNILVIDAGTCLKFDFINSKAEYLGGRISPGLQMRYKALHNYTDQLPLIEVSNQTPLIGNSTKNSIISGVQQGMISEIEDTITKMQNEFGELLVILTGGDAKYFDKAIKNSTFAHPNLVAFGLNKILKYNVE